MKKSFVIGCGVVLAILLSADARAYPSPSAKATILELLNGKVQKGQLGSNSPVSFDELNCSRPLKVCSLGLRFMIPQDDFFVIRKGFCNVEPVDTVYDILDDKTGDLTDYFLQSVKKCL